MKVLKQGAVFAFAALAASGAFAQDVFQGQDIVHDARGNVVRNTWGHCVHTIQKSGTNECGVVAAKPAPAPAPAPALEPAPQPKAYK